MLVISPILGPVGIASNVHGKKSSDCEILLQTDKKTRPPLVNSIEADWFIPPKEAEKKARGEEYKEFYLGMMLDIDQSREISHCRIAQARWRFRRGLLVRIFGSSPGIVFCS